MVINASGNILSQSSAGHLEKWYVPPEQYSPTRLCGVIMQKDTFSVLFGWKVR
jgi:hypothetical protein